MNEYVSPGVAEVPCDGVDNDCDPFTVDDDGCGETGDTGSADTDADATDDEVSGIEGLSSACSCGTQIRPLHPWSWLARR